MNQEKHQQTYPWKSQQESQSSLLHLDQRQGPWCYLFHCRYSLMHLNQLRSRAEGQWKGQCKNPLIVHLGYYRLLVGTGRRELQRRLDPRTGQEASPS